MKALLVIDMLRDFIDEDGALPCGEAARGVVSFIKQKIDAFRAAGDTIIYICDSHEPNDKEFKMFRPHCVKDTKGAEIIRELKPAATDTIVQKNRYSAFYNTALDGILKATRPEEVHVTGVCTSICVMDTVGGLRNRDYTTVVYEQGVADFDNEAHAFALKRMKAVYGAQIA